MPPTISTRPQTSRQARRAYLKAGGTVRLSERELRQIERSAQLQERADRIKERENKRKANLKKKHEKIEKEREARQRMGIPSPLKETVGSSQMRLDAFKGIGLGFKRKREDTPKLTPASSSEKSNDPSTQRSEEGAAPARSPLQPRSTNVISKSPVEQVRKDVKPSEALSSTSCDRQGAIRDVQHPEALSRRAPPKFVIQPPPNSSTPKSTVQPSPKVAAHSMRTPATETAKSPQMLPPPKPVPPIKKEDQKPPSPANLTHVPKIGENSMAPPPAKLKHPPAPPKAFIKIEASEVPNHTTQPANPTKPILSTATSTKRMPPPSRPVLPPQPKPPITRLKIHEPPKHLKPIYPQAVDDGWAAFLVSNTQIERELSTDEIRTTSPIRKPMPPLFPFQKHGFASARRPALPTIPRTTKPLSDETAALLAGICTQDLDYDADLPTTYERPGFMEDTVATRKKAAQSFGDDAISDAELEGATKDIEERSSGTTTLDVGKYQKKAKESLCDDFFDISTQDFCELVTY